MDLSSELLIGFLVSIALGGLIGMERELTQKNEDENFNSQFAGLRTYALISLTGFMGAYLSDEVTPFILVILLLAISGFFLAGYLSESRHLKFFGITSEISALLAFIVGAVSFYEYLFAVLIAVATVMILAFKKKLHQFAHSVNSEEFFSTIKFIIIAFVILPLLPKEAIDPWGVIQPFDAWLMVVFVSGINFVGYILVKSIGASSGLLLTSLLGGLASSTATTVSLAEQSRKNKKLTAAITAGVLITSMIMFIRALVEVFVVNRAMLSDLILMVGAMILMSVTLILFLLWLIRGQTAGSEDLEISSPFRLWPALQFGLLYVVVLVIAELANRYFGDQGIYVASALAGITDVDAITLSLSNLSLKGDLPQLLAAQGISIAIIVNTAVKLGIVYVFGTLPLFRWLAGLLGLVIAVGMGAILWV